MCITFTNCNILNEHYIIQKSINESEYEYWPRKFILFFLIRKSKHINAARQIYAHIFKCTNTRTIKYNPLSI